MDTRRSFPKPLSALVATISTAAVIFAVAFPLGFVPWSSRLRQSLIQWGIPDTITASIAVVSITIPQFIGFFVGGIFCASLWRKLGIYYAIAAGMVYLACDRFMFYRMASTTPNRAFHVVEMVGPVVSICLVVLGAMIAGRVKGEAVADQAFRKDNDAQELGNN